METANGFLNKFLVDAWNERLVDAVSIKSWIKFLMAIASHEKIPYASTFKGKSILLLAFCLNPLAEIYQSASVDETIELDDRAVLLESLCDAMKVTREGFDYKTLSPIIASNVVKALEKFHQIFITHSTNILSSHMMKLLLLEVSCKLSTDYKNSNITFLLSSSSLQE